MTYKQGNFQELFEWGSHDTLMPEEQAAGIGDPHRYYR
jgi:hypothetical protein